MMWLNLEDRNVVCKNQDESYFLANPKLEFHDKANTINVSPASSDRSALTSVQSYQSSCSLIE